MLKIILTYVLLLIAFLGSSHYLHLLVVARSEDGMAVIQRPPHVPTLLGAFAAFIVVGTLMYFILPLGWQRGIAQVAFLLMVIIVNVALWRFALNREAMKAWLEPTTQDKNSNNDQ